MKSFQPTSGAIWTTTCLLLTSMTGCSGDKQSVPTTQLPRPAATKASQHAAPEKPLSTEKEKTVGIKSLILSKENKSQRRVRLGKLQFDDSNRATLVTEGSGPAVEQLKQDWSEVSSKPELTWKMSVPDVVDGKDATRVIGSTVRPGDDTYPEAVLNTMERSYGYNVEIGD